MPCQVPILLVTFNRPDTTKIVFEKIKELKPSVLYIYSDAPRLGNVNDEIKVNETRKIFDDINWECAVHKSFQETNLGCGAGVSHAIEWLFNTEEMAIILEDDCVPHISFFEFCIVMLNRYKDNEKVMHVSGTRWNPEFKTNDSDYIFSRIGHIWGWATWRRAWSKYDFQMSTWPSYKKLDGTFNLFKDREISKYWDGAFDYVFNQKSKHTWDYQWQYTLFSNNALAVVPSVNLVSNIGTTGVHASQSKSPNFFKETGFWVNSETPPELLEAEENFDIYHMKKHFLSHNSFVSKVYRGVQKLFAVR